MKLHLLIVDDEELIRQGLRARIEYLNLGIDQIFEAENGKKALDLIRNQEIDFVLTDIRMPDMNGLTLIREIQKIRENIAFAVLSGYAEFAYAEEAIRLGVKGYLLKPVANEELKNTLVKMIHHKEMAEEGDRNTRIEKERKELLIEKEINSLSATSEEKIISTEKFAKLTPALSKIEEMKKSVVYFGIFRVSEENGRGDHFKKPDKELIRFSIKNVFSFIECSCEKIMVNSLSDERRLFAIFIGEEKSALKDEISNIFYEMKSVLEDKMKISFTVGISKAHSSIRGKALFEAQTALKQRVIYGNRNLYFLEDIMIKPDSDFPSAQVHLLKGYLERNEVDRIKELMEEIFSEEMAKKYGSSYLVVTWVQIIHMIFQYYDGKSNKPAGLRELLIDFNTPSQMHSLTEIKERMTDILIDCAKTEKITEMSAKNRIRLALRYISEHYSEVISINDLAERYEMSPNYFSSIFKKEIGKSAINYITEIRMKKAKEFLVSTDENVIDISKRVGYEDGQYFFRVFKKYTGMTPLKYREEHQ